MGCSVYNHHITLLHCRLDEIAYHFSFTYYSMLGGGQGPDGLNQLAGLYLDHSVSNARATLPALVC